MSITISTSAASHGSNFSRNPPSLTSQSMNSNSRTRVMSELDTLMRNHHIHPTTMENNNDDVKENPSVPFDMINSQQNTRLNESYPETTQQPETIVSPLSTAVATLESAAFPESDGDGADGEDGEEGVNLDLRSSSSFTPWHASHALSFTDKGLSSFMHKTPTPALPLSSSSSFLQWKAAQQASTVPASAHRQQRPSSSTVTTTTPSPSLQTPLSSSSTRSHPFNLTINTANTTVNTTGNTISSKEEEEHRWALFLRRVQRQEKDKHRAIQRATKQKHAVEMAECYFSPNLAVKSLEIAKKADLQPLTKRAAALMIAQRQYREQQRVLKEQREVMACSFTPTRKSPPRSSRKSTSSSSNGRGVPPYPSGQGGVLTSGDRPPSPSRHGTLEYYEYMLQKKVREEALRAKLEEQQRAELTFRPNTSLSFKSFKTLNNSTAKAKTQTQPQVIVSTSTRASTSGGAGNGANKGIVKSQTGVNMEKTTDTSKLRNNNMLLTNQESPPPPPPPSTANTIVTHVPGVIPQSTTATTMNIATATKPTAAAPIPTPASARGSASATGLLSTTTTLPPAPTIISDWGDDSDGDDDGSSGYGGAIFGVDDVRGQIQKPPLQQQQQQQHQRLAPTVGGQGLGPVPAATPSRRLVPPPPPTTNTTTIPITNNNYNNNHNHVPSSSNKTSTSTIPAPGLERTTAPGPGLVEGLKASDRESMISQEIERRFQELQVRKQMQQLPQQPSKQQQPPQPPQRALGGVNINAPLLRSSIEHDDDDDEEEEEDYGDVGIVGVEMSGVSEHIWRTITSACASTAGSVA